MQQLVLRIDNDKLSYEIQGGLTFSQIVQVTFTLLHSAAENLTKAGMADFKQKHPDATEEDFEAFSQKLRGDMYDMVNVAATNTLYLISPETELRPDLTAEAILKAENELLDKTQTTE